MPSAEMGSVRISFPIFSSAAVWRVGGGGERLVGGGGKGLDGCGNSPDLPFPKQETQKWRIYVCEPKGPSEETWG